METKNTPAYGDRRYGVRKAAEKIKNAVTIEAYLQSLGVELHRNRAKCVVHDGSNRYSFSVNPGKQLWYCHSCQNGGDLIDLCELVEKHADKWTAVVSLSQQFGVELPERPDRWHKRQSEKEKTRQVVTKHLARTYQRRLVKLYAPAFLDAGGTPEERSKAIEELSAALWPRCLALAERRINGES